MSKTLLPVVTTRRPAWNKGRLIEQKRPLQPKQVWAIRARLELENKLRDLALFNLAIDSKLRGCDLVRLNSFLSLRALAARKLPRLLGQCRCTAAMKPAIRTPRSAGLVGNLQAAVKPDHGFLVIAAIALDCMTSLVFAAL